jgi:hypothetical protein
MYAQKEEVLLLMVYYSISAILAKISKEKTNIRNSSTKNYNT